MMYVIYKQNGEVAITQLTDLIQQGSNNANKIFIKVIDEDLSTYSVNAVFDLPNGKSTVVLATQTTDDTYGDGYLIKLTSAETLFAGIIYLNLQVLDSETNLVRYYYRVPLTVNKTTDVSNNVNITLSQYNNLVDSMLTDEELTEGLATKQDNLYHHTVNFEDTNGDTWQLVFLSFLHTAQNSLPNIQFLYEHNKIITFSFTSTSDGVPYFLYNLTSDSSHNVHFYLLDIDNSTHFKSVVFGLDDIVSITDTVVEYKRPE